MALHRLHIWRIWTQDLTHQWWAIALYRVVKLPSPNSIWIARSKFNHPWVKIPTLKAIVRSITITSTMWDLRTSNMRMKENWIKAADRISTNMMYLQAPIMLRILKTTVRCLPKLRLADRTKNVILLQVIWHQLMGWLTDKFWLISLQIRLTSIRKQHLFKSSQQMTTKSKERLQNW